METKRFFVDLRSGCVAVRDRTIEDPFPNGCGPEHPDVVWFRMGVNLAPDGGSPDWVVPKSTHSEAMRECNRLNAALASATGEGSEAGK